MLMSTEARMPVPNQVLAAAGRQAYQQLLPYLQSVTLSFGETLYPSGDVIRYVYFPCDSLVSLLTVVDKHLALEVGMVGCEGMVGVGCALGVASSPVRAMVQGKGTALRMAADTFVGALQKSQALQGAVLRYAHALIVQISQTAACNRFHPIQARLARWLLMTRDRVGSNQFHLTHEFLANMLGVRRVGVTQAASALKSQQLIDYSRGHIDLLDGAGLEQMACSCYERGTRCHALT